MDPATLELGDWTTLPARGADEVVLAGSRTLLAGPARLLVYAEDRVELDLPAEAPAPGRPRLVQGQIHWGPGVVDLAEAQLHLRRALVPPQLPARRGPRAATYAWSPDGARTLVSLANPSGPAGVELHGEGQPRALWSAADLAPTSLWLGRELAVLGLREPQIHGPGGERLATLSIADLPLRRLQASADERWLIAVVANRSLALIDLHARAVVDQWTGAWVDAALSPDGHTLIGLEWGARLRAAAIERGRIVEVATLEHEALAGAQALAFAEGSVALVGGGTARRAPLRLR